MSDIVAENLKRLLPTHGGKSAVARNAKISRNTLDNALKGKSVKHSKLAVIASALNVNLEELTTDPSLTASKARADSRPQRVWWTTSETARLNLHIVSRRYGVEPVTVLESAPILFAVAAEQSLANRRRRLTEVENHLHSAYFDSLCDRFPKLRHGVYRAKDGLAVEARSIDAFDIDGHVEDPDEPGDGSSPFVAFLTERLHELGLGNFEAADWGTTDSFARDAALFEDEIEAIHGNNERARFAVRAKPSIIGLIPKDLVRIAGEDAARAERRYHWLGCQVSDAVWEAHLNQMRDLELMLGDI